MSIRSGALRHRVTLEAPARTREPGGLVAETWAPVATVWAAIEPLSGSEQLRGMQMTAAVTHRIRTRYRGGVTPAMRVTSRGRVFDVRSVLDEGERHRELVFLAEEQVSP